MKTIVVVLSNSLGGNRKDVENTQGQIFHSLDEIREEFPNVAPEAVGLYTLCEFMDACNDSDDDCPKELKVDLDDSWIGYVNLK